MTGERVLVLGYTWTDGLPVLRVRPEGSRGERDQPLRGEVRLVVTAERRCVGYAGPDGPRPCPDRAVPIGTRCAACERRDVALPCITCDGFRCPTLVPEVRRRCQSTHHLYLACFGDPRLKVGTASHLRRDQRVIEQGPLAAARVAEGPGPRIKQAEALLVAQEDLVESMRRGRKTSLLGAGMTAEQAQARVAEVAGELRERLPPEYHHLLHRPDFVPVPPLAERVRGWSVAPLPVDDGVLVAGTVAGAVGHLVFLDEPDGRFAIDLGELKARVVVWGGSGGKRPVVQLGLF